MVVTLETLHREMKHMKNELHLLRYMMEEEYDLSEETIKKLEIARKTPRSEYIRHEDVKKMLLK